MSGSSKPVVLVPACNRVLAQHPTHTVGKKYIDAVRLAGALPLVVPAAGADELDELLALADGVMLTGSPSNVAPHHFGEPVRDPELPLDPQRDAWTLPLVPRALALGLPLLAICRGFQEMNVALGGSLHQAVHEVGPYADHREDEDDPLPAQYAPAHRVTLTPGGVLAQILQMDVIEVNSLHGQGVHRLAPALAVEGVAPDGLIEAFSVQDARGFALGVQWHPEWQAEINPASRRLFQAFGDAARDWRQRRGGFPGT
jgi:putative glutamine amidotransferase